MANGGGVGDVVQETVVRLGTQIDNEGVNKLFSLLDSSKLKAMGLTAAITGVTTAIYKMIESATKREFELEALAKQQKKTVSLVRAENSALKAMGKTMDDIKKDDNMKKIYNDIVKFNKEIAFPDMENSLRKINNLQGAFYKFKSALGYTVQWMNAQLLANLEAPIERITKYLEKGSLFMRDQMPVIASKIGLFVTDFAKGIFGIVEGVGKVVEWFNALPDSIKQVGIALGAALAVFNTGPVGKLLALVGMVGDVIHDYDNYHWNQDNAKKVEKGEKGAFYAKEGGGFTQNKKEALTDEAGNPVAYQVKTAFDELYEIYDSEDPQKGGKLATKIGQTLTGIFSNAFKDFSMDDIFGEGTAESPGLIKKITDWFKNSENSQMMNDLGQEFVMFISRAVSGVGGVAGGAAAKIIDAIFAGKDANGNPTSVISEKLFSDDDGSAAATFAGALGGYVSGVIEDIKKNGFKPGTLKAGLGEGLLGAVITSIASNIKRDDTGKITIDWKTVIGEDLASVGETFLNIITESIGAVQDVGGIIFGALSEAIGGIKLTGLDGNGPLQALGESLEALAPKDGENSVLGNVVSAGIASWFASGSIIGGIIGGISTAIKTINDDPSKLTELQAEIKQFGDGLVHFLFGGTGTNEDGEQIEFTGILDAIIETFGSIWETVQPYLEPLREGLEGWFEDIGENIAGRLSGIFELVWTNIYNRFIKGTVFEGMVDDPNKSTITEENGSFVAKDTQGRTKKLTPAEAQYFLKNSGGFDENGDGRYSFAIDENGQIYGTNGAIFKKDLQNHVDYMSRMFLPDPEVRGMSTYTGPNGREYALKRNEDGSINWDFGALYRGKNNLWTEADGALPMIQSYYNSGVMELKGDKKAEVPVKGEIDTSDIQAQLNKTNFEAPVELKIKKSGTQLEPVNSAHEAWGGRIGSEMNNVTVGEDGPEYIIPITKRERAMNLINQMLNEMGMGALAGLQNMGLGGASGTIGNSMDSILGSIGSGTTNVSAPVNIYVNATGADGKEIGTAAYDAAERHLTRTLRGVVA